MTIIQKQRQLYFLGYYKARVDGIWGYQSKSATKRFQSDNGLEADGVFGALTEKKMSEIVVAIQKTVGAEVDGIAGAETMAKTKAWQKKHSLYADGIAGEKTRAKIFGTENTNSTKVPVESVGDWWGNIKYFNRSEFACKCGKCGGFPVEPVRELVELLDKVRGHYGKPFTPNSAVRCAAHNKAVGGSSGSQHLYGTAADIPASALGVKPKELYNYLETMLPNSGGIGLYSWGCHVDVRAKRARWRG